MPSTLPRILAAAVVIGGVLVPAATVGAAGDPVLCGGTARTTVNGRQWTCTFDDEFDGSALDRTAWVVQTTAANGFHSGGECLTDDPDNISVAGGSLQLTVRRAPAPFTCQSPKGSYPAEWTGSSVYTRSFDQLYGRVEIRARFPEAGGRPGLQSALWMYPRQMTLSAASGLTEIDIAEAYSRYQDWIAPAVHRYLSGRSVSCQVPDYGAGFHTYAVEWSRRAAIFFFDGKLCMRALGGGTTAPFLLALSQVLGVTSNVPDALTPSPATMQVDYVRVWK